MNLTRTEFDNFFCPDDPGEASAGGNPRRSVTVQEARILREWAVGQKVLEIGTGLGISTRALAASAKEVVSVDVDPWCHSFQFPSNVRLMRDVPDENFDLAFIDGDHRYEAVMKDIARVKAPVIAFHDCDHPQVLQAIVDSKLQVLESTNTVCKLTLCRR